VNGNDVEIDHAEQKQYLPLSFSLLEIASAGRSPFLKRHGALKFDISTLFTTYFL